MQIFRCTRRRRRGRIPQSKAQKLENELKAEAWTVQFLQSKLLASAGLWLWNDFLVFRDLTFDLAGMLSPAHLPAGVLHPNLS